MRVYRLKEEHGDKTVEQAITDQLYIMLNRGITQWTRVAPLLAEMFEEVVSEAAKPARSGKSQSDT